MRKIITAWYKDALENGTINWDVTLSKALSLLLIAPLAARSGVLNKDKRDEQLLLPFICWNDITMKLVNGEDINNLLAEVVSRNEKGHK
jgi:hypothetical protein